jgi:hypothetical protein
MVSSRDRRFRQRPDSPVKTVARTPPPAFLFPNHNVKDPTDFRRPRCLTPAAGGGSYLGAAQLSVNRILSDLLHHPQTRIWRNTIEACPSPGRPLDRPPAVGLGLWVRGQDLNL